ncbi:MAG: hypothetical protein DMG59_23830 [Acidobacteria bacterium]|jgi:hypothetical protein|nr:MAG: hypothetical protein DMG59_23830 [Acidobacteriota bacterium]
MSRKTLAGAVSVLALAAGLLYYNYGGHEVPPGQPPLARLTPENFSQIKSAFNEAGSDIRLLVLLSPT